jgi:outer membrane protein assembly factor BamB
VHPPLIRADGSLVFGTLDGSVHAVDTNGDPLWSYPAAVGVFAHHVSIAGDGTIYVTTDNGEIVALTPTGAKKWSHKYATSGQWIGGQTPAVAADGTIYVSPSFTNAGVTALNPDGSVKWVYWKPGASGTYHQAIDAQGNIIVAWTIDSPFEAGFVALGPDKTEKWSLTVAQPTGPPALGADGTLFFGWGAWNTPFTLAAWKPGSSQAAWTVPGWAPAGVGPAIGADGAVVATHDHMSFGVGLQIVSPVDGSGVASSGQMPGQWIGLSGIALGANGEVYVGSSDALHAFGP